MTNQEKIDIITNRLNNLELMKQSFIYHAEEFKDKYSLEDELSICNAKKEALIQELEFLGGTWNPLTNQG